MTHVVVCFETMLVAICSLRLHGELPRGIVGRTVPAYPSRQPSVRHEAAADCTLSCECSGRGRCGGGGGGAGKGLGGRGEGRTRRLVPPGLCLHVLPATVVPPGVGKEVGRCHSGWQRFFTRCFQLQHGVPTNGCFIACNRTEIELTGSDPCNPGSITSPVNAVMSCYSGGGLSFPA